MSGIIYLVQPAELVGTKRYKIGCSKKTTLDRVKNGYKKGTRYLHIAECDEPHKTEEKIKEIFNNKFTLIAGNEYYEGDELIMKQEFINLIMKRQQIYEQIKSYPINKETLCFPLYSKNKKVGGCNYDNPICDHCNDTGTQYWSDDVYGFCHWCEKGDEKKIRDELFACKSISGNPSDAYACFSEEKAELMTVLLQKNKSEFISLIKKYNDDHSYGVNIINNYLIDKIINCDFLKGINHLYIHHGTLIIELNNTDVLYINNNTNINIIKQIWNNIRGNSDAHDMKIIKTK